MTPGSSEKVSVLISALEARYAALDAIRGRTQNISIWSLGLLLAAAGWTVQSGGAFSVDQTAVICVGVVAAWMVLRVFLAGQRRGLKDQQAVAATIEDRLGLYGEGRFGPGSPPIFPEVWRRAGAKGGRYFQSPYALLDVGLLIFLAAMLSRSDGVRVGVTHLLAALNL